MNYYYLWLTSDNQATTFNRLAKEAADAADSLFRLVDNLPDGTAGVVRQHAHTLDGLATELMKSAQEAGSRARLHYQAHVANRGRSNG